MPELPEVETVVRELSPLIVGRRIASVEAGDQPLRLRWSADWAPRLIGRRFVQHRPPRQMDGHGPDWRPVAGLPPGHDRPADRDAGAEPLADHTHIVILASRCGSQQLRFRDIRRFGSARLFPDPDELSERFSVTAGLGPEPFDLDRKQVATVPGRDGALSQGRAAGSARGRRRRQHLRRRITVHARLHPGRRGRDLARPAKPSGCGRPSCGC